MMAFNRRTTKRIATLLFGLFILFGVIDASAQAATDIFVVYTGRNTAEKDQLMNALPKNISTRAYNVDYLAFSDYTGLNKAVARMNQSKMIIIIQDTPMLILKGARLRTNLLVAQSAKQTVRSSEWTLHVVGENVNLGDFKTSARRKISSVNDLGTEQDLRALNLLVVNEQTVSIQDVISRVAGKTVR